MKAAVIPVIVEQHAEEAAFLWILRSHAVHAPHYKLKDLAKLDNRVEGHLDGLRIAGDDGWKRVERALAIGEAGEVFAAAVLALESRNPDQLQPILETVEKNPESDRGLISALGWLEPPKLAGTVKAWLLSDSVQQKQFGIAACAAHRVNPGRALDAALLDEQSSPGLIAAALRTAGQLRRKDLLHAVRRHLSAEDEAIRFWAAWSSILLGDVGAALDCMKSLVVTGTRFRGRALGILLRWMDRDSAVRWLKSMARYPQWHRDLVTGAGILGDSFYVPWLIKQMEIPVFARPAGEAFSQITGVDIAYEDLDGERPEGFESGPTENPEDEDVAMDPDEDLPWPDPEKILGWWERNGARFPPGHRYLWGGPITVEQCRTVLLEGYQRQRAAAALELARMQSGSPLFETCAPGGRQQMHLLAMSGGR